MLTVPYNHCDPPESQIPLPIEKHEYGLEVPLSVEYIERRVSIPTATGKRVVICLRTDSKHLALFFAMNWSADTSSRKPDATIIALKKSPVVYGLSPDLQKARWFCPETNQVWMFGNEFYGNIKITVRGLCSELAPLEQMFMHGCALSVDGHGLVLSGTSGAGKTTLTAALRKTLGGRARIVNDDWGPCSLTDGQLQFTGEPHLHMKYPSVHAFLSSLNIDPSTHHSENLSGDINDPRARLLIAPSEVFGNDGLDQQAILRLFVVVMRDPQAPPEARYLSQKDMHLIEQGKYSCFYDRTEWFLNGSLFIVDEKRKERERKRHEMLLNAFPCLLVNNMEAPGKTAGIILAELEKIGA